MERFDAFSTSTLRRMVVHSSMSLCTLLPSASGPCLDQEAWEEGTEGSGMVRCCRFRPGSSGSARCHFRPVFTVVDQTSDSLGLPLDGSLHASGSKQRLCRTARCRSSRLDLL